ncbi:MAG TPA: formyltransferase family protein [Pseudolabrys sp.]|nr:formyltransferase family protein [Pseudolabrys sp.]
MFDTVILLTGPAEQSTLAALLKRHNPQLTVHAARTLADLDAFNGRTLRSARLVAFLSPVIVPKRILDRLGFGAYNFHPGPPDYPGFVPCHFATYDGAIHFGATAHAMVEKVDAGPIVGVELFDIPAGTSVVALERLTFTELARLFWKLSKMLATQAEPLEPLPIGWCGKKTTRRMYEALCDIPLDIARDELERRLRVFGGGHFSIHPTITIDGHRFCYVRPQAEAAETSPLVPAQAQEPEPVA